MTNIKPIIKLYVITHKQTYIPNHPLLIPLQVGVATHNALSKMQHDNAGENISQKNNSYCELTGQYWAWKNDEADYYGFCHYRRYFTFKEEQLPYRIENFSDDVLWENCGYDSKDDMSKFISQYDLIVPKPENMNESVYLNYVHSPHHFESDLQLAIKLVKELYPDYVSAMEQYLNGAETYLKNMYIMRKKYFYEYCEWLFPLLEEFDCRNDWGKYNGNSIAMRVDGYLAERLFGIWYTHLKLQGNIKSCELSYIVFDGLDEKGSLKYKKFANKILPPGTKLHNLVGRCKRYFLKKMANKNYKS